MQKAALRMCLMKEKIIREPVLPRGTSQYVGFLSQDGGSLAVIQCPDLASGLDPLACREPRICSSN